MLSATPTTDHITGRQKNRSRKAQTPTKAPEPPVTSSAAPSNNDSDPPQTAISDNSNSPQISLPDDNSDSPQIALPDDNSDSPQTVPLDNSFDPPSPQVAPPTIIEKAESPQLEAMQSPRMASSFASMSGFITPPDSPKALAYRKGGLHSFGRTASGNYSSINQVVRHQNNGYKIGFVQETAISLKKKSMSQLGELFQYT